MYDFACMLGYTIIINEICGICRYFMSSDDLGHYLY